MDTIRVDDVPEELDKTKEVGVIEGIRVLEIIGVSKSTDVIEEVVVIDSDVIGGSGAAEIVDIEASACAVEVVDRAQEVGIMEETGVVDVLGA